ncbi:phospholipase-like protein [Tanacetum coccineum]
MEKRTREYLQVTKQDSDRVTGLSIPQQPPEAFHSFYEDFTLRGIRVDRFQPGFVSCSFTVPPRLTVITTPNSLSAEDRNGNMAVGAIANLVDEIGATMVYEKDVPMNVSIDMSISYLSTAKLNDDLEISAKLLGGKGAFNGTLVILKNKATGEVIAEGRHSLFGFGKLSDDDAIRLCLLLAVEVIFMGRLLTFKVDDTLFRLVKNLEAWNSFPWGEHLWCHLYDEIKNLKQRYSDEHYYGLKKDRNYVPTYTLSGFVFAFQILILETYERCESWWIKDQKVIPRALGWSKKSLFTRSDYSYLFANESRAPPIKEQHSLFESYLAKLEKARKRGKTGFIVSSIGATSDNSVKKKWLNDLVIMELNYRVFKLETIIQVLAHERNDRQPNLQFTDAFRCMTSDLCDSLNIMFADLIQQHDSDEDISQDYLREEELRLCLEDEEMLRCEHEKLIVEENRFRLDEANRLRLEEENMLQLEEQKKNKRKEFMNSSHGKNILAKLAPAKRNQLGSSSEKINSKVSWVKIKKYRQHVNDPCTAKLLKNVKPWVEDISRVLHCMDTVWLSDDIERFLGQPGQVKCKFPWNDDYTVDRNFWLKLVCLDPARKGWLTEEVQLPVVLERANVFQKKGIDPSKYTITFRLADNVPKQGAYMVIVVCGFVYFYIGWRMACRWM